jgi:hypothetical protein
MSQLKNILYLALFACLLFAAASFAESTERPKSADIVSEQTYDAQMEFFSNYLIFEMLQVNTNIEMEELQEVFDSTSFGVVKVAMRELKSAIYFFNNVNYFIEKQYDLDALDSIEDLAFRVNHYNHLYPRYVIVMHNTLLLHTNGKYQLLGSDSSYSYENEKALEVARNYMRNIEIDEDMQKYITAKTKLSLHNLADTYLDDQRVIEKQMRVGDYRYMEFMGYNRDVISMAAVMGGLDLERKVQDIYSNPLSSKVTESKKREQFYLTTLQKINLLK